MMKKQRQVTQLTSDDHTMPFSTNQGKAALIPALPRREKAHESKKSLPLLSFSDCIRQSIKTVLILYSFEIPPSNKFSTR